MEKLMQLRNELKVPKTRYNKFGNFNYRSQEDILDAIKPLLEKYKLGIIISDEMIMLGDRYYIKTTITVKDGDNDVAVSTGYAREPYNKKGMDEPQISGTASSYARKYALNAMFLIDDTKDPDTDEYHKMTQDKSKGNKPKTEKPKAEKSKTESEGPEQPFSPEVAKKAIIDKAMEKQVPPAEMAEIESMMGKAKTRENFIYILKSI